MKTRDYKVGEVFQFRDIKLKCVEGHPLSCKGCIFENCDTQTCVSMEEFVGQCVPLFREDQKKVMFIKVEENE